MSNLPMNITGLELKSTNNLKVIIDNSGHVCEILDTLKHASIILDKNVRIVYMNSEAERLIGKKETLMSKINAFYGYLNKALETKEKIYLKGVSESSGNKYDIHICPINEKLLIHIYVKHSYRNTDYNDAKDNTFEEEISQLECLHVVGQMAASIGHEIRNPMTTVRGFLQLLSIKEECKKYYKYFELMINELDRANAIISEFLNTAKYKNEERKKTNINKILDRIMPLIEADAIREDKKVIYKKTEDLAEMELDENSICQLIINLVRNGLEAMEAKKKLFISTFKENNDVVLSVKDQGKGISPSILANLGAPFLTTKKDGTGLGLNVCYRIAAKHNAKIFVETSNMGTTFYVRFPLKK